MEENPTKPESESDKDRVIDVLVRTVEELKKDVNIIKNNKIAEELQLPQDLLEASGVLEKPPTRLKSGHLSRPILESEILEAKSKCSNESECARYLGINFKTYKRWAKKYGMWSPNPWGKGSKKRYWAPDKGKYPLNRILNGEFPEYPVHRLKDLLIRSGTKQPECENCGFSERRITDNKMPLVLNFEDGNEKNHKLENVKLFCYNCTFTCGKGYLRTGKVKFYFGDPDRMQGSSRQIDARF